MMAATSFQSLKDDFDLFDDWEDRYRAIVELGRTLEPMDNALKTEASKVRGCSSQVWLVATRNPDGALHFLGDSDALIVRGLIAVLFLLVQDRMPAEIAALDVRGRLGELGLATALSPTRTNGLFSMVQRIQQTATEMAA